MPIIFQRGTKKHFWSACETDPVDVLSLVQRMIRGKRPVGSTFPMRTTFLRLLFACLLTSTPSLPAQVGGLGDLSGGRISKPKAEVQAALVAARTALVPGQPLEIGLKLVHPVKWHTYWLNPGIGTPTKLTWELPEGWTTTPLIWPVPLVKPTELGNQHIYEETTWLFSTVTPPADLKPGLDFALIASAKWLVCDEGSVCMPGGSPLTLTMPVAANAEPVAGVMAELEKVKAVQPVTSPSWKVQLEPKWTVTLTPQAGANPDPGEVYLFDEKRVISLQPQKVTREAGVIKLTLEPHEDAGPNEMPSGFIHATKGWLKDGSVPSLALTSLALAAPAPASTTGPASAPAAAGSPAPPASRITFWGAVLSLFAAGIILNLMPCVFPVLALKVLGFVQQAGKDPGETRRHSYAYAAGLLIFVWLVAGGMLVANSYFGADLAWGDITRYSGVLAGVVIVLYLLGLNLAGLFEIGASLTSVGGSLQDKKGYAGSFWSGALTMVISTPCSGPFMAVAMGFALKQGPLQQFVLFTAFGLGIALPYVLLSSSPKLLKKLPRPGAWMETFKKALSFPMFAAAIFFFNAFITKTGIEGAGLLLWGVLLISLAAWIYGHWGVPSRSPRARSIGWVVALIAGAGGVYLARLATMEKAESANAPHVTNGLEWIRWSPGALAAERAKGRPVFVDYTTINCYTCEVNERVVFKSPGSDKVIAKFKELNVAPLRAKYLVDGTPEDNAIRNSLKPWDISTFPAYLMYPADPAKAPFLVSDSLLSQQEVIAALEKAQ